MVPCCLPGEWATGRGGACRRGGGGGLPALRRVGLPERREGAACLAAARVQRAPAARGWGLVVVEGQMGN